MRHQIGLYEGIISVIENIAGNNKPAISFLFSGEIIAEIPAESFDFSLEVFESVCFTAIQLGEFWAVEIRVKPYQSPEQIIKKLQTKKFDSSFKNVLNRALQNAAGNKSFLYAVE